MASKTADLLQSSANSSVTLRTGVMHHFAAVLLGVISPVLFAVIRLFFAYPMSWFAHPYLAFLMFIPCSFFGFLIPRAISDRVSHCQGVSSKKIMKVEPSDEARFWGAFGFYAFVTSAYFSAGLNGGFMTFVICISMLMGWIAFCFSVKSYGYNSINFFFGVISKVRAKGKASVRVADILNRMQVEELVNSNDRLLSSLMKEKTKQKPLRVSKTLTNVECFISLQEKDKLRFADIF